MKLVKWAVQYNLCMTTKRKNKKAIKIGIAAGIVLLVAIVISILELTNTINLLGTPNQSTNQDAETTSDAPTAQKNFTNGNDRQPLVPNNRKEGTVKDNEGNIPHIPDESRWSRSANGELIVYSPASNAIVRNGDTLSGKTKAEEVWFRLIDDVSGVIARGKLKVVNGTFSGNFEFTTSATQGRLDVFNARTDGTEYNNIEIPVRFR